MAPPAQGERPDIGIIPLEVIQGPEREKETSADTSTLILFILSTHFVRSHYLLGG